MKVIIIEEARFKELVKILDSIPDKLLSDPTYSNDNNDKSIIDKAYRKIRYELIVWLQSHGVDIT